MLANVGRMDERSPRRATSIADARRSLSLVLAFLCHSMHDRQTHHKYHSLQFGRSTEATGHFAVKE